MITAKPQPDSQPARARNSERARALILEAAEVAFAEHGFDGARMDAIAKAASYNISLLFQYFGDKLGLYAAVLRRANAETAELQKQLLVSLPADPALGMPASAFREFLESAVQTEFDYLASHPRLVRIMTWEMAEGWQTYAHVASQLPPDANDSFEAVFTRARQAGLLRSSFSNLIQLTLIFQVCQSYLAFRPMYQAMLPGEEMSSERMLARAREHLVGFIMGGMLVDQPPAQSETRQEGAVE